MPVIYTSNFRKGFIPCSRQYQKTLRRLSETKNYDEVRHLFLQAHVLLWKYSGQSGRYHHISNRGLSMSRSEFERILQLPGQAIDEALVRQQCPLYAKLTSRIGPQQFAHQRAFQNMIDLQKQAYEQARQQGLPLNITGVYEPSPLSQEWDEKTGRYELVNRERQIGEDGGPCHADQTCNGDHKCENNLCVLPKPKRKCPPFQQALILQDDQGTFEEAGISALRTQPVQVYSSKDNQWHTACKPDAKLGRTNWIRNPRLRDYVGLPDSVDEIPLTEWQHSYSSHNLMVDPETRALYYLSPNQHRQYASNSAYSVASNLPQFAVAQDQPGSTVWTSPVAKSGGRRTVKRSRLIDSFSVMEQDREPSWTSYAGANLSQLL